MRPKNNPPSPERAAEILAQQRREAELRQRGYRERALRLFPHVCARCGREFSGKRLRELTVHHRDHNHRNNPADGSNWELLCLYCHDHEHEKYKLAAYGVELSPTEAPAPARMANPFEKLDSLLKKSPRPDEEPTA
jgi:hypothetical protein